jgi:hypothetical protein
MIEFWRFSMRAYIFGSRRQEEEKLTEDHHRACRSWTYPNLVADRTTRNEEIEPYFDWLC